MPTPKTLIKRHFPQVKRIVDSERTLDVTVTAEDTAAGNKLDPENCALAKACVRQKIADAAIIGISTSYLIRGDTAIRYHTSTAVSREITSFDRHDDFAEGQHYKLSRISPSCRQEVRNMKSKLYHRAKVKARKKGQPYTPSRVVHRTANVRILNA